MPISKKVLSCALILLASAHGFAKESINDVHSFANIDQYRQTHLELDLLVDFPARSLRGKAILHIERQRDAGRNLTLDTRDIIIRSVAIDGRKGLEYLPHMLGPVDEALGRKMTILLPRYRAKRFEIHIEYETSPGASGLQWLNARQTAGGEHPFLFSQSQAIHARSWVPLQDTPAVRFTYEARIHTPAGLRAVMSADNNPEARADGLYLFKMEQPIPSYLLAIAAGNLEFGAIGPRTGVYAEPELLAASLSEFEDTEKMLEISEKLFGPYRWGRYDLLILPPSFPFGGMENPRLSFITPTVLAGDKSLVGLIAHELAHSWSGNLVTNATWRDLWLNEGFTVFLESRIMEALYGERRRVMEERLGYEDLVADIESLESRFELLAVDLEGEDPDLVFSQVPYEKGRLMLVWLDQLLGRETMNAFLTEYFDHFAFTSISTADFLEYLDANLLSKHRDKVTLSDIKKWIFEPGLPDFAPVPPADVFAAIDTARTQWLAGEIDAAQIDTADWSTQDWLYFLNNTPERISRERLDDIDAAFSLTAAGNNEIAHSWLRIAIRHQYEPAWSRLENYLLSIGRNKLVKPLYQDLMKSEEGADFARRVFEQARPGYHPLTVTVNERILYPSAESE